MIMKNYVHRNYEKFFFCFFLLTLQSYYIKNTHTAMIEGLDNRTRIPY